MGLFNFLLAFVRKFTQFCKVVDGKKILNLAKASKGIANLLCLLVLFGAGPAIAQVDADEALEKAVNAYDIQRDLPGVEVEDIVEVESQEDVPDEESNRDFNAFWDSLSDLLKALFVAGAVILGVFFLWFIFRNVDALKGLFKKKDKPAQDQQVVDTKVVTSVQNRLADAQRLAAEGRFEEAVHFLLLHTIDDLKVQTDHHLPQSWTAREILRNSALLEAVIGPLDAIVQTVEKSFFGGSPIGKQGYDYCIAQYEAFILALEAKST
ncbi:MAG: hypothetical protein PVF65_11470 [Sphingomonadales bacterium]